MQLYHAPQHDGDDDDGDGDDNNNKWYHVSHATGLLLTNETIHVID